jgi:hypothetical protein
LGEGWTDPWLFGWVLAVESASNVAACMIVSSVVGVVARPAGSTRAGARLELAVTAECVAIQIAVAFGEII